MVRQNPQPKFVVSLQAKRYNSTQHFVQIYHLSIFHNHLAINPNFFVSLVHASTLRIDKLTYVEPTMT